MVVDGSSKSKKSRKNNGGNSSVSKSNATLGGQEPQQQPNQNENSSQQPTEQQRMQSPDIISDKQRADLLLEASMHQSYHGDDDSKNESDESTKSITILTSVRQKYEW